MNALWLCRSDEPSGLTSNLAIVLLQYMDSVPAASVLLVDMDFMVIRTQCNF